MFAGERVLSLSKRTPPLNEEYCINEKKAVRMIEGVPVKPQDYKKKIDEIITLIGANQEKTRRGVEMLQELIAETERLVHRHGG